MSSNVVVSSPSFNKLFCPQTSKLLIAFCTKVVNESPRSDSLVLKKIEQHDLSSLIHRLSLRFKPPIDLTTLRSVETLTESIVNCLVSYLQGQSG